jgi:hypothetical protein
MARTGVIGFLVFLNLAVVACGSSEANTTAGASGTVQATPGAFFGGAAEMPLSMKLPVGTLMLEDTPNAVTPAQAKELLPLWQMLRALEESSTSSEVEIQAVLDQIQEAMTPEQVSAMEDMDQEDMRALFEELGMGRQQQQNSEGDSEGRGGFVPPEGMMPPGGGEGGPVIVGPGGGDGGAGMGPGGFGNLSPEERATITAGRGGMRMGFGTGMIDAVIELLETRAAES